MVTMQYELYHLDEFDKYIPNETIQHRCTLSVALHFNNPRTNHNVPIRRSLFMSSKQFEIVVKDVTTKVFKTSFKKQLITY